MPPIPKVASYLGFAKESTAGTPVTATKFFPFTSLTTQDVKNYVPDEGIRGSMVDSYDQVATQGWSTFSAEGPFFADVLGMVLKGLMGEEAASGTAPTTHTFTVLNSGAQAPTFTVSDYNGFNTRQFAYGVFSSATLNFAPDALLTTAFEGMSFASATASNPTKAFETDAAKPSHLAAVSIGGSSTTLLQSGSITIARQVDPILAINNTSSPTALFGSAVNVSGSLVLIYQDDTFLTPYLNGTVQALDLTWTSGSGATAYGVNFHATQGLFTNAVVDRGDNYNKLNVDFFCKPNPTDVGTSAGYGPCKVVLTNQTTAAY